MTTQKIVKWVIAHEPIHLFLRTAEAFAAEIEETTKGALKIEVLTVPEYVEKYNDEAVRDAGGTYESIFDALDDNRISMSQTVVSAFGKINKDFYALDLPFLFRDHDHVSSVVDGPIGKILCDSLAERSGLRGLAFTYSGGYRVIGSNKPIVSLNDLQDSTVRVNGNPVNFMTMQNIGAQPKTHNELGYGYDEIEQGSLDAAETTYLRFKGTHVLKTQHSMFMTTIAVSKKFWNELDETTQELFKVAAANAAAIERKWSIEDCEKFEQDCDKNGITISSMTDVDRTNLKALTQSVYDVVDEFFTPGFVANIRNTH